MGANKSSPVATKQHYLDMGYFLRSSIVADISSFHNIVAISDETSPQEIPILIAVSFLSPVSIHTLTPAFLMDYIVCLTLSWS